MQHQTLATIIDALVAALPLAGPPIRDRIEQILLTSLPALGDHLPTRVLERSMVGAAGSLRADGRPGAAEQVDIAWQTLVAQRGRIKSRGNRDQPS